ncbi:MAG: pilin [Candidatus Falkowbacteria bacterium]|nr:pilin [Candidatus Falkowbacteria bacterium]
MSNNYFKFFSLIFLSVFLFSNIFFVVSALADTVWKIPDLQIKFSDKIFSNVNCTGDTCSVPWIAEYIVAIYKYAVGAIGILAVVVMMLGGITWITAGGSPARVGEAKAWITASVVGLVLLLCSYTILYFINPKLTSLTPIKITKITLPTETAIIVGGCSNCVDLKTYGINTKNGSQVNREIADKLINLPSSFKLDSGVNLTWQVTEAWPPTGEHKDPCHQNGTCIDIAFVAKTPETMSKEAVQALGSALLNSGFRTMQYESVSGCELYLKGTALGFECVNCQGYCTGNHFHVE